MGRYREIPVLLFLAFLCVVMAVLRPNFLDPLNIRGLGRDLSVSGTMAIGMTAVILTGGIDLSVASILALSSAASSSLMLSGITPVIAILAAFMVGAGCGALNGVMIAWLRIPPIIVTLGMLNILQATMLILTRANWLGPLPASFSAIGYGFTPLAIMLVEVAIGVLVLGYTRYGRHIYAVGGSEEAARLAGISVEGIRASVYVLSGLAAAAGGVLMSAINSGIQANDAVGCELTAIAAVVIGGTSITGGQGSVVGSIIGAAIAIVLRNGMVLMGLEARWSDVIMGAAIFLAVALERLKKGK